MPLFHRITSEQKRNLGHWAMEFSVVVVGVLLALWLQQWANRRSELHDERAAEAAVHAEVRSALTVLIGRAALDQCLQDRLSKLRSDILKSSGAWTGIRQHPFVFSAGIGSRNSSPAVYEGFNESISTAAWNSALTTGAFAPMDRDHFNRLVTIYSDIDMMRDAKAREDQSEATLSSLAGPLQLTPEVRTQMLTAIWQLERSRWIFTTRIGVTTLAARMQEMGWNDADDVYRWTREAQSLMRTFKAKFRPCVRPFRNPFPGGSAVGPA